MEAAYAHGLVCNHPFVDGNKRTAFVAAQLFLRLNGHRINAPPVDCVMITLALAASDLDEATLAAWLRRHLQPR
ncbi:MAG: type II toxin-antitoxin system death-on-curing family toxin [Burkholderiaceae bacterium]